MGSEREDRPGDPLGSAGQSFEEHERELLEKLMARVQRDIPKEATVAEAIAEMRRAVIEDEDAQELLFRVTAIQSQNSGYIRSYFDSLGAEPADLEVKYRATAKGRLLAKEELDLMQRLGNEIEKRLPPGLSEEEREARVMDLLENDEELASMAARLEQLMEGGGPPIG